MKKLAFGAFLLISAMGMTMTACGGGDDDDDDVTLVDGGDDDDDDDDDIDAGPAACNPVAQTGCGPGMKCTYITEALEPVVLQRTECTPDGTVELGGACALTSEELPQYDNCVAGTYCINSSCKEICSTAPNSCADGFVCSPYTETFEDIENIGVCEPGCDPVSQNCVNAAEACNTQIAATSGSCGGVPGPAADLTQDDICYGPGPGVCYLNGCAKGFGGLLPLNADAEDIDHCAAFCTPANTSSDTVNHPGPAIGVDSGEGYGDCPTRGAVAHQCRFLNSFYGGAEITPDSVGFCAPTDTWGDCETMDPETQMDENGTVVFGCISTNYVPPAFQSTPPMQSMPLPEGFVMPPIPLPSEVR